MSNVGFYARKARNETDLAKKIDALSKAIEALGDAVDAIEKDLKRLK
jgi:hypothetical protein